MHFLVNSKNNLISSRLNLHCIVSKSDWKTYFCKTKFVYLIVEVQYIDSTQLDI